MSKKKISLRPFLRLSHSCLPWRKSGCKFRHRYDNRKKSLDKNTGLLTWFCGRKVVRSIAHEIGGQREMMSALSIAYVNGVDNFLKRKKKWRSCKISTFVVRSFKWAIASEILFIETRGLLLPEGRARDKFRAGVPRWVTRVVNFCGREGKCSDGRMLYQASPVDEVIKLELRDRIDHVIQTLTYRQREVIKLRFGLTDDGVMTLEAIGRRFRVTREVIRQNEAKAIRMMKMPIRSDMLAEF